MENTSKEHNFIKVYNKACKFYQEKKYEEAINAYKEAISIRQDNYESYVYIMDIYKIQHKDYEKALEVIFQIIDNVQDVDPISYINAGYLYAQLGDNKNSLNFYQKANDTYREKLNNKELILPENYFEVGFSYYLLNDIQKCLEYYKKSHELLSSNISLENIDNFCRLNNLLILAISQNKDSYMSNADDHFGIICKNENQILNNIFIKDYFYLMLYGHQEYEIIIKNYESTSFTEAISPLIYEVVVRAYCFINTNIESNFIKVKELIINNILTNPLNDRHYFHLRCLTDCFKKYGEELLNLKEYKIVENALINELEKQVYKEEVFYKLGLFYYLVRKKELAIKSLKDSIIINENYHKSYELLATIYYYKFDYKMAYEYGKKYLELNDDRSFKEIIFDKLKAKI